MLKRWIMSVAVLAAACGGETTDNNTDADMQSDQSLGIDCANPLVNVPASEWVRSQTDIESYDVRIDINELKYVRLTALDASGQTVAELSETQAFGDPTIPDGTMLATLTWPDAPEFVFRSLGREITGGYEVAATLEHDSKSLDVDMVFERLGCDAVESSGPDCAGPADVTDKRVSVPTCGLFYNTDSRAGLAPQLTQLNYRAKNDTPVGDVLVDGADVYSLVPALRDGQVQDLDAVDTWLAANNKEGIIDTDAHTIFSAIYTDMGWRDIVDQISGECQAFLTNALVPRCQTLAEDSGKYRTIRQAACGNAGGRDIPKWALGGDLPTAKHNLVCGANGCSFGRGDPHLSTFDGHRYDFQGAGEYTLAKTAEWEVQARFEPQLRAGVPYTACANVSVTTAIAVQFGDDTVEVRTDGAIYNNGVLKTPAEMAAPLSSGLKFMRQGSTHVFEFADGTTVTAETGSFMNVEVFAPPTLQGHTTGLFGVYDGSTANDMVSRGGRAFELSINTEDKYRVFGESWRVSPAESFFTYALGESYDDFDDPSFPDADTSFDDVPDAVLNQAAGECRVEDISMAFDCILDVICVGESGGTENDAPPVSATPPGKDGLVLTGDIREDNREQRAVRAADNLCPLGARPYIGLRDLGTQTLSASLSTDQGSIPAGSTVHLWELELEALDPESAVRKGSVTFPSDMLGTISANADLRASDGIFQPSTSTGPEADDILIPLGRGLQLELYSSDDPDLVRVITEVTP